MAKAQIDVVVEPLRVEVCFDSTSKSPHGRFYVGFVILAFLSGIAIMVLFAPGKHGEPGAWQRFRESPSDLYYFLVPSLLLLALFVFMAWLAIRAVRVNYPGGQKLECDGMTLTISRLRWLDWSNKDWITQTYALSEVSRLRYAVIVQSRSKSTWGLHLTAAGKGYRLFPHLTTQQAGEILGGLEALGVNTDRVMKAARKAVRENR